MQQYETGQLPHPSEIEERMDEAWGFDYYQPARRLLVRFDPEWDARYIQNSLRHFTFEKVRYAEAIALINRETNGRTQQKMRSLLASRSKQDAYYQAMYRHNDPNVRQRLRAWRPHIEVLLPWSLRQRFMDEIQAEARLYAE